MFAIAPLAALFATIEQAFASNLIGRNRSERLVDCRGSRMIEKNLPWKWATSALFVLIASACSNVPQQLGQSTAIPPVVQAEELCSGLQSGACWMELENEPGCYVWQQEALVDSLSITWSGGCSKGLAQGKGTITIAWSHPWSREARSLHEGEMENGKRTGYWELRDPNFTERGEYWRGTRTGTWEISAPNGWHATIRYPTWGPVLK